MKTIYYATRPLMLTICAESPQEAKAQAEAKFRQIIKESYTTLDYAPGEIVIEKKG